MCETAQAIAKAAGVQAPRHVLRFDGARDKDPRTYNRPASAEVACAIVGEGPLPARYISIYERFDEGYTGHTHALSSLSEHVDPLPYPLIHVEGTLGYSIALSVVDDNGCVSKRISMKLLSASYHATVCS